MDRAVAIATTEGIHALTMARIAQEAGIGRATLYKYFKDVEDILASWHRRQIAAHLYELELVRARYASPIEGLREVLLSYTNRGNREHDARLGRLLHAMPHIHEAQQHLLDFVTGIVAAAIEAGELDRSVSARLRAHFALGAIEAGLSSRAQAQLLVDMIMRGLGGPA
ncbi:MAG: TetR/AcrR family transcriptional regulator [Bauldia sp.]